MVVLQELNNMFWGLTLDGGRRYSQTVDRPFHVSMAALESNLDAPDKTSHVQVMLQQESSQFLLCTLGPGSHLQQQLDLQFSSGESVEFFLIGKGVVHLTGSLLEEESDFADDFREDEYDSESDVPNLMPASDSDDEEDIDWEPEEEPVGLKRRAMAIRHGGLKKAKITELDGDEDDEEDGDYDSSFIDDEALEEEEEEESAEDEEEEEDEESSESPQSLQTQLAKRASTPDTSSEASASKKKKKKKKDKALKANEQANTGASPAGDATNSDTPTKKKKKKKKKKNKQEENTSTSQQISTEKPPESPTPKPSPAVGKKRTVAGGTSVEDSKIGHGPEAKPGKMVSVYYSGILAKSNKRFDSCLKGKPFRFRLGRGEVIKGWDTGLIGMKVGGKRKITVPPSQGYGNARQGPIPPGSTLTFDVELKAVS